jgi:hypothetical protein
VVSIDPIALSIPPGIFVYLPHYFIFTKATGAPNHIVKYLSDLLVSLQSE